MKKLLFIAALFCCIGFVKAQDTEPTLKETTDWLTSKLDGLSFYNKEQKFSFEFNISFNGCICTYKYHMKSDDLPDIERDIKYIFNLGDISLSSIFYNKDWFVLYYPKLELTTNNKQETIKCVTTNKKGVVTNNFDCLYIYLPLNGNLTYERVYKALTHAIKLCGGKEEKF